MTTETIINELMKIHPKGFDLSLDRVNRLLSGLGNPHLRIPPAIHVAGTNGKGSTIAFCRAILEAAGYGVHVHTSPHLVNWAERYRLANGKRPHVSAGTLVDDDVLEDAIRRVAAVNNGEPITVFEILSATMFVLFSEHEADYSLVEVGLGGRFDATNVLVNPVVSLITPVSLDHQAYLGDTVEKIAFEKAGIIKQNCPAVVGFQEDGARETIEAVALERGSSLMIAGQDYDCYEQGGRMVYNDEKGLLDLPLPRLIGRHQIDNAGVAIAAIRHADIHCPDRAFELAMQTVMWAGRMERLQQGDIEASIGNRNSYWIDGGHNPSAGEAIATEIASLIERMNMPVILVCAMLTTKEPNGYISPFKGLVSQVVTVPIQSSDAGFEPSDLADIANAAGLAAKPAADLAMAMDMVGDMTKATPAIVLFCGSLYLVGDVLALNGTPPK